MAKTAQGFPTKEFFVGMLTRDIELNDAILDLLDNCLDGVVRQKKGLTTRDTPDFYKGFYSKITITNTSFTIEDNCGGIPMEVAEKYAFRMGRSAEKSDDELPTVGIYGIGMKRAIFKIGRSAVVTTRNDGCLYTVTIPEDWSSSEDDWNFPIEELHDDNVLSDGGTSIEIQNINSGIAELWDNPDKLSMYIDKLIKAIEQSYSFIIQKGFEISINGRKVTPLPIELLVTNEDAGIKPFIFTQDFGDVSVKLVIGFYAPPPSPEDIDDENDLKRSTADAGWTIVCNDRVVLYNDKSHLTGWGEAGVPQYHTQFIGIRGIVIFESNNPKNLPMTTTKRGVDTSSYIYAAVKNRMRQGLKMFTDYTNRWKGQNEKERVYSTAAKRTSVGDLLVPASELEKNNHIKLRQNKGGLVYSPDLPKPANDKPYKVIRYTKALDEIEDIIEYVYNDRSFSISPSDVGKKCFEMILDEARKKEGN